MGKCTKTDNNPSSHITTDVGKNGDIDKYFALTCFKKRSYHYDSFDAKYETMKVFVKRFIT